MPRFDTPQPIFASVDVGVGSVRIGASARDDTVVEVRPSNEASGADVHAAEQTRVEYASGKLTIRGPRSKVRSLFGKGPSVDVSIDLPEGSDLQASGWATFDCEGRLGNVRVDTAHGDIELDRTANLRAKSASGYITVARIEGDGDVNTSAGNIRIGDVDGAAVAQTSSGSLTVGTATGDLQLKTAYGDIGVDRALTSVAAKTAYGRVRIGEVVSGSVVLESGYGKLEVGIREGTATWLDVSSQSGTVRSSLKASDAPAEPEETVEIRARTRYGDIVLNRA